MRSSGSRSAISSARMSPRDRTCTSDPRRSALERPSRLHMETQLASSEESYNDCMDRLAADPEYQAEEKKNSQWRIKEAYQALVELRRSHLDFMKIPIVTILRSRCEDCYAYDLHVRKKYEESDEQWRPPDIAAATWKADLSALGVTKAEIRRIIDDPDFSLGCDGCNHWMVYGVDNIYTSEEDFTSYFEDLL